jgi:hypothetical protein
VASGRATWGRVWRYGLISGTVAFVLLGLTVAVLPGVGDGMAAFLMYAALVVTPTLAARRFAPETPRRPRKAVPPVVSKVPLRRRPSAAEAAQRAVTSYGELLRLHPYAPGPSADPDDLADYRTALDIYDEAGRSAPGRVPELLERGRAALERLDVAGLAGTDVSWIRGTGGPLARVPWPAGGGAALLVFETDDAHAGYSVCHARAMGMRQRELLRGEFDSFRTAPVRARVLVPGQRGAELLLDVWSAGHWRIALRPAGELRRLAEGVPLNGRGTEMVRRIGASRVVEFEHHGEGAFAVHEVTRSYRTGRLIADGLDKARLTVAVPDHCVLRIDAAGRWTLRDPGARERL